MNCAKCHEYRISPIVAPGGGFFCKNNHGQCTTCNKDNKNRCNICQESTLFVKMHFIDMKNISFGTTELWPKRTGDMNDMIQQKMGQCDKSAEEQSKKRHLENSIAQNLETETEHKVTGDKPVRLLTKVAKKSRQTRTDPVSKMAERIVRYKQRIEILQQALKRIELKIEYEKFLALRMQCKEQKLRVRKQMKVVAEASEPMYPAPMAQVAAKLPVTHTIDRKPTTPAQKQHSVVPANVQMSKPSQRHNVIATCKEVHHITLPSLNLTEQKSLLKEDTSNRLQSILQTIKEDKVFEEEDSLHRNIDKVPKKITFKVREVVGPPAVKLTSKKIKDEEALLPICQRAAYKRYKITVKKVPKIHGRREYFLGAQSPQMEPLLTQNCAKFKNVKQNLKAEQKLYFSYSPVTCPSVDCLRNLFISELSQHIVNDHRSLTMERILSHQMKTFLFDTNVEEYNTPICQIAYFVKDKNVNFGRNKFANFLPVVLMAGKTHCNSTEQNRDTLLMFWFTGFVPENAKLTATITFYPIYCNFPEWHTTCTCTIYSMRAPQDLESIRLSGCSTILHSTLFKKLTDNGKEFLGLQVVIN